MGRVLRRAFGQFCRCFSGKSFKSQCPGFSITWRSSPSSQFSEDALRGLIFRAQDIGLGSFLSLGGHPGWSISGSQDVAIPGFSRHTWINTCLPTKITVKGKDETNECKYEQLLITAVWFCHPSGSQAEWEWGKVESSQRQKRQKKE